jgi:hypothetical protein
MKSEGNGQPIRFDVHMSTAVANQFKELHRREADVGRGKLVLSAFRKILTRLQQDPLSFGEPLYRLPVLRLLVRQGAIRPLRVDYAVHEHYPLVFIRGVQLLP